GPARRRGAVQSGIAPASEQVNTALQLDCSACYVFAVNLRIICGLTPLYLSSNPISLESFMAVERTLSIIKPDAVAKNVIGQILSRFEQAGLSIVAAKMVQLSQADAEGFYAEHKERPFFKDLVSFMTSGPVVVQVLEGEGAVLKNRDLMGATNPKEAAAGTIRADFAESIDANAVHGSDSTTSAAREIGYFFAETELCQRTR